MIRNELIVLCFALTVFCESSNEIRLPPANGIANVEYEHKTIEPCEFQNCTEKCPGFHEVCTGCCKQISGADVVCFRGVCQLCYENAQWTCSAHIQNQDILMTATQIALSAALILGILTIFVLFWKICSSRNQSRIPRRRLGRRRPRDSLRSGRSVDTIQQTVSERLRDAPPPYNRSVLPPPGDTPPPYVALASAGHSNACFDPDYNADPPSYSIGADLLNTGQSTGNQGDKASAEESTKRGDGAGDVALHI